MTRIFKYFIAGTELDRSPHESVITSTLCLTAHLTLMYVGETEPILAGGTP